MDANVREWRFRGFPGLWSFAYTTRVTKRERIEPRMDTNVFRGIQCFGELR